MGLHWDTAASPFRVHPRFHWNHLVWRLLGMTHTRTQSRLCWWDSLPWTRDKKPREPKTDVHVIVWWLGRLEKSTHKLRGAGRAAFGLGVGSLLQPAHSLFTISASSVIEEALRAHLLIGTFMHLLPGFSTCSTLLLLLGVPINCQFHTLFLFLCFEEPRTNLRFEFDGSSELAFSFYTQVCGGPGTLSTWPRSQLLILRVKTRHELP